MRRIDLSDLERLEGIAEALERLFWCLIAVAFLAAILGSPGTGLLLLILGAVAFVVRAGLEDFVRSRRDPVPADPESEITIYRTSRSRANSAAGAPSPSGRRRYGAASS